MRIFEVAIHIQLVTVEEMPAENDTSQTLTARRDDTVTDTDFVMRAPRISDGAAVWSLTKDTKVLDVNSSYSYLLWCRDFSQTSVVAVQRHHEDQKDDENQKDDLLGFVTGYLRPDDPTTLMVWQVAVAEQGRGRGLASAMVDHLVERSGATWVETTITDDNVASNRLFASLATRHGAGHDVTALFTPDLYPDAHETEFLHRIGPLGTAAAPRPED